MADVSDIEMAMASLIANSLQLGINYLPGSAVLSPASGAKVEVYRGWPIASHLSASIADGVSTVSIFPVPGSSRRTTRYFPQWSFTTVTAPTLTVVASGSTVTIGGTSSSSQVIGIRFGTAANATIQSYRPAVSDSPSSIAATLAALIQGATFAGPVITLPSNVQVSADVVSDQVGWIETRRQEQNMWVIGWCPTPASRDAVMKAVDGGFANMLDPSGNLTDQFPLPDGSSARLQYMSTHTDDQAQRAGIWRRDLRYCVSYPSTLIQSFPTMLFGTTNVTETTSGATASFTVGTPD